jgi:hypothetical protein
VAAAPPSSRGFNIGEYRHIFAPRTLAFGAVAVVGAVGLFQPLGLNIMPPCPLHAMTGLDCPLCGATRATRTLLLHGDVRHALDLNALYVVALPLMAVIAATWLVRGKPPTWVTSRRMATVLIGVATAFAVVRNLPFGPFRYLKA